MATATQVTIKVVVDGTQAGPAIDQINRGLGEIGVKGSASLGQAGAAADNMGMHVSTSLDGVRLLSQEFGMRMPRAMEAMISRMPGVSGALGSILPLMAGIAGIEIFARVIDGAKKAYDEFISLNTVIDKYNEGIEKARQADLPNTRDNETTRLRLLDQTHAAALYGQQAEETQKQGKWQIAGVPQNAGDAFRQAILGPGSALVDNAILGFGQMNQGQDLEKKASDAKIARDALARKNADDNYETARAQIELDHGRDIALVGVQKTNAEKLKKEQIAAAERTHNVDVQRAYENEVSPTAGVATERLKDQTAEAQASAERVVLARSESEAIMHSRHEAIEANLQGEDLYHQKMLDDTEELRLKLTNAGKAAEIPAAVEAVNAKYFADVGQRAVDLQNKTALAVERANVDAMPDESFGDRRAKVTAGMNLKINEINTNATLSPDEAAAERVAAVAKANAEIGKLYDDQDMQEAEDQDKAAKMHERILDEETAYAQRASEAERRVKQTGLNGWVQDYANAVAAIQAQDEAETQKLDKLRADEKMSDAEYAQAKTNIDRAANAEIEQQNQAMAHQIANTLNEAFTNPIDFIKRKFQQMMMDILANALMQSKAFQSIFGSTMGGAQPGAPGAARGGILGTISGAVRGTFPGHPAAAAASSPGGGASAGGAPSVNAGSDYSASYSAGASSNSPSGAAYRPEYAGASTPAGVAAGASGSSSESSVSAIATGVPGLYRRVSDAHATMGAGSSGASISDAPGDVGAHGGIGGDVPQVSSVTVSNPTSAQQTGGVGKGVVSGVQSAQKLYGTISGAAAGNTSGSGAGSSSPYSTVGDDDGNVTLSGDIPTEDNPDYQTPAASSGSNAAAVGMGVAGAGVAGYEGYEDTKSGFKSGSAGGTMKGMLGDAMAGATIGSLFGPMGTLIGAGVGAAVGLVAGVTGAIMGEGGKLAARDYYKKSIFPEIEADRNDYSGGDFQTAVSDVNRKATDGMDYMTKHWGAGAANWVNQNYLLKEQKLAVGEIEARAKGGSYAVSMSAAQFHSGGTIRDFGDLATSSNEGFIHAMLGEKVANTGASSTHGPTIDAMNAGATPDQIGKMYQRPGDTSSQPGGDMHLHIHTLDTKTMEGWMRTGGAQMIAKHLNDFNGQYAGDGISG